MRFLADPERSVGFVRDLLDILHFAEFKANDLGADGMLRKIERVAAILALIQAQEEDPNPNLH